jgi:hypothetical protein
VRSLSTDETLKGLGIVIVLALACRLVSARLRLPAIVLLLPVGFVGALVVADLIREDSGFLAITVIYGLTAAPVARLLGLAGAGKSVVLVVGGNVWARAIALALKSAGLGVRLWTGRSDEQAAAREAGLEAGNARLGVDLASREEELEEITDALLMTESDDFNALAAFELRQELGRDHVYRLPARAELLDLVPAYAEGQILFDEELTFSELTRRFDAGARLVQATEDRDGMTPVFVLAGCELTVVTAGGRPDTTAGHTTIGITGT